MALILVDEQISEHLRRTGDDHFTLSAHDRLHLRYGPTGELIDCLNERIPGGRSWDVHVYVTITETHALDH